MTSARPIDAGARGLPAVARGFLAVAQSVGWRARGSCAVDRGSCARARDSSGLARRLCEVARGFCAIARRLCARAEGSFEVDRGLVERDRTLSELDGSLLRMDRHLSGRDRPMVRHTLGSFLRDGDCLPGAGTFVAASPACPKPPADPVSILRRCLQRPQSGTILGLTAQVVVGWGDSVREADHVRRRNLAASAGNGDQETGGLAV
jgi:hypothetical protein